MVMEVIIIVTEKPYWKESQLSVYVSRLVHFTICKNITF